MRSIENWQHVVHSRNVKSGFYDYKKDIAIVEEALKPENKYQGEAAVFSGKDEEALLRILADYKKAMLERKLLLVIGEVCEAHEELRSGHDVNEVYYNPEKPDKPEGVPVETTDAHIRLLDFEQEAGINTEAMMVLKHAYNETRPYKHGRQF